jgi:hypothetical protein
MLCFVSVMKAMNYVLCYPIGNDRIVYDEAVFWSRVHL